MSKETTYIITWTERKSREEKARTTKDQSVAHMWYTELSNYALVRNVKLLRITTTTEQIDLDEHGNEWKVLGT